MMMSVLVSRGMTTERKGCTVQRGQDKIGSSYERVFEPFEITPISTVVPVGPILVRRICSTTGHWASCDVSLI